MDGSGRREFTVRVFYDPLAAGDDKQPLPTEFALEQNYPNPFNASTMIKFAVPEKEYVEMKIYNLLGQKVRTLLSSEKGAGWYSIIWDGKADSGYELPTGVYLMKMKAGEFEAKKKLMMLK